MRGEVLKGHLDTMLLAMIGEEPAHGYRIVERLRERSGGAFSLPEGTVYPALYRLEANGLVASGWANGSGRRRRVYRLTRRGRAALDEGREDWRGFSRAVTATLQ
ncbi:MAG: PadR family transcriptional regulator [Candidatus Dormibacteraeota bacterium]|nr:PadR family transcriptional regulator [Candidatus Dormibacteraeota bacterium]